MIISQPDKMSEKGHSRHFDGLPVTSGLPLEADIVTAGRHVSKVPKPEVVTSLNHLVGTSDQRERYTEAERLGTFEIEEQLYFCG